MKESFTTWRKEYERDVFTECTLRVTPAWQKSCFCGRRDSNPRAGHGYDGLDVLSGVCGAGPTAAICNAEQIVLIGQASADNRPGSSSLPDIRDWREQSKTFNDIAYWELAVQKLERGGQVTSVPAIRCSVNLFSLLGTRAALGRTFFPNEDKPENTVAVLSAAVWKSSFNSDPGVINSSVRLGEEHYTVIGVMPDDFIFPLAQSSPVVWVPVQPKPVWEDRNTAMLQAVGRLNANVSIETAENELAAITGRPGVTMVQLLGCWSKTTVNRLRETCGKCYCCWKVLYWRSG